MTPNDITPEEAKAYLDDLQALGRKHGITIKGYQVDDMPWLIRWKPDDVRRYVGRCFLGTAMFVTLEDEGTRRWAEEHPDEWTAVVVADDPPA